MYNISAVEADFKKLRSRFPVPVSRILLYHIFCSNDALQ